MAIYSLFVPRCAMFRDLSAARISRLEAGEPFDS